MRGRSLSGIPFETTFGPFQRAEGGRGIGFGDADLISPGAIKASRYEYTLIWNDLWL